MNNKTPNRALTLLFVTAAIITLYYTQLPRCRNFDQEYTTQACID